MTSAYVCLDASDDTVESSVLRDVATVHMLGADSTTEITSLAKLGNADVVAVWHTVVLDERALACMPQCRAIVRMGVGFDNVDVAAAGRLGIPVANIPDYGTEEVADSALALILGLFRGTLAGIERTSRGEEIRGADAIAAAVPYIRRVRGSVLGLVGLGRIGMAVAVRAKACGFEVHFFDPYVADGFDKAVGITRQTSLDALLAVSACISLHCNPVAGGDDPVASRSAPRGYIDAARLAQMARGAFLVNTARGELGEAWKRKPFSGSHLADALDRFAS